MENWRDNFSDSTSFGFILWFKKNIYLINFLLFGFQHPNYVTNDLLVFKRLKLIFDLLAKWWNMCKNKRKKNGSQIYEKEKCLRQNLLDSKKMNIFLWRKFYSIFWMLFLYIDFSSSFFGYVLLYREKILCAIVFVFFFQSKLSLQLKCSINVLFIDQVSLLSSM